MPRLAIEDRIEIMEIVAGIAAEAVKHPETARDPDLQVRMVEELYRAMVGLIEEDDEVYDDEEEEDDED